MRIEEQRVEDLIPYENNPRNNDDAVDKVALSISSFGFKVPIIVDRNNVIVAGHTRLRAAKKLGLTTVPTIRADDLTDDQIRAFRLADNKVSEFASWDMEKLEQELEALDIDMSMFGFDALEKELEDLDIQEDDYEPDEDTEKEPPRAKVGDIYKLGDHRLMCGDSSDPEAVRALMGGAQADMVFTDPPYGVAIGSRNKAINEVEPGRGGHIEEDIIGDTASSEELYETLKKAFTNLRTIAAKDSCSYYVTSPQGGDLGLMMMMMKDAGLPVRHILIWVKNTAVFSLGRLDYDYRHEPVFYTWTKKHTFYGGYSTTVIEDMKPVEKMSKPELRELVHALMEKHPESVIHVDKPMQSKLHPTMKPIKLIARFVINSSREGDVVADIFGGSGSTLITCEQTRRKCYMMELDPHYVDVIIDRWEQLTGNKAEKIISGINEKI